MSREAYEFFSRASADFGLRHVIDLTREPIETQEVVDLFTREFFPTCRSRARLVFHVRQGDERVLVEVVKGIGLLSTILGPPDRLGVCRPLPVERRLTLLI